MLPPVLLAVALHGLCTSRGQHGICRSDGKFSRGSGRLFATRARRNKGSNNGTKQRLHQQRKDPHQRDDLGELIVERGLVDRDFFPIIGSDESGRGAIAGPVIAASCCIIQPLDDYIPIEGVADSKMLTPEMRSKIFHEITSQPDVYAYRISSRTHAEVDEMNIQKASMAAFAESIDMLVTEELKGMGEEKETTDATNQKVFSPYSIVDGKQSPKLDLTKTPCRPWVKGDGEVYTVALASILARVTHENIMKEAHLKYPQYGFDTNKGHASPDHVEAIHAHGPTPIHRKSVRTMRGR